MWIVKGCEGPIIWYCARQCVYFYPTRKGPYSVVCNHPKQAHLETSEICKTRSLWLSVLSGPLPVIQGAS